MMPTKVENVHVELAAQVDKCLLDSTKIFVDTVIEGDEFRLKYDFSIRYFDKVHERLSSLLILLKHPNTKIKQCQVGPAIILVEQVLNKLREIETGNFK